MKNVTSDKFDFDLVYEFCNEYDGEKSEGTITGYRWSARSFLEFIEQDRGVDLSDVDWKDLRAWIKYLKQDYPDSTVKTRYNHIRTFFRYLRDYHGYFEDRGILPPDHDRFEITNHITRGSTAKSDKTASRGGVVYVTPDEYEMLVENVPNPRFRNELIVKMLFGLGLRRKELVDLQIAPEEPHRDRYGHIDFDDNRIQIPSAKSDDPRPIWFGSGIGIPLKRWITSERKAVYYADESNYLFPSRSSKQLTPKRVSYVVREAAENAGIQSTLYTDANGNERKRITPHALRHGFAVQHVRNGTNIKTLRDLLGHEDLSTTQIYLQFDDKTKRQAQHRNAPNV